MSEQIPHGSPEEVRAFIDSLRATGEEPTEAPPPAVPSEVVARRSISWPTDLDQRVKAAAEARGVSVSELVREWAELELTALGDDRPISRADALRALAGVRPLGGAA